MIPELEHYDMVTLINRIQLDIIIHSLRQNEEISIVIGHRWQLVS